jgi:hypothetical protein
MVVGSLTCKAKLDNVWRILARMLTSIGTIITPFTKEYIRLKRKRRK